VIDLAVQLVEQAGIVLLGPLRHLARHRGDVAKRVLGAALASLDGGPVVEAGRCIADQIGMGDVSGISAAAVRSLIMLAGAPEDQPPISRYRDATVRDASGLRAVADAVPEVVTQALREMLPPPARRSVLAVPPGTGMPPGHPEVSDLDRISAANAAQGLARTHPDIACAVAGALVLNLGVDSSDPYDRQPVASVQHALAAMLAMQVGDIGERIERAGRNAGGELRDRLFGVLQAAARLLDPDDRWRKPGDPLPDDYPRRAIFDQLTAASLARATGDWGDRTRFVACELVSDLTRIDPHWALGHVSGFLGAFLTVIEALDITPATPLIVAGGPPPHERAAESSIRQTSIDSAARHLLNAVASGATARPLTVLRAVNDLITDERDTDRGPQAVRRLLPVLGRIGRRHGAAPGVLAEILPVLHTYMVDREPGLRSAALRAWAAIGLDHDLPSSVADLLPALLADRKVIVARAVLAAVGSLDWSDADRDRLFAFAYSICLTADADRHGPLLKDSMAALDVLAEGSERLQAIGEALILRRAADLDRYDLRDVLERDWSSTAAHSAEMAVLRLRQARDPEINDRINYRGDKHLCALLDCGPGLAVLPADDLISAAAELAPGSLIGCAEYAEVAWRAGRPGDAAAVMRAIAQVIPAQPAYDSHRAITQLLADAADFDAVAQDVTAMQETAGKLAASAAAAVGGGDDYTASLMRQVRARATARFLLAGQEPPDGLALPAEAADSLAPGTAAASRLRADRLTSAAAELETLSQRATITAAYIRLFAGLCTVAAHLLRYDAAELDADTAHAAAHMTAARRQAGLLEADLAARMASGDPLATGLRGALTRVPDIDGDGIAPLLASWAALPLPVLIVNGPRPPRPAASTVPAEDGGTAGDRPVAVVLASLDGQLITGPQVLRPATVYELGLEIRPGVWPDWASRLDAELISHLTAQEAETPAFSWQRPATVKPGDVLTGTGTLILRFGLPAGRPAPPFRIALRWHGTRDGAPAAEPVGVAGHRELRFRPYDASRDYLTSQPAFDERLLGLYEQLHSAGYNQDQLQAFCRLFTAICRAGLRIMWDPRYKRGARIKEKEFHDDLYSRLQAEPELGGRLERGSRLALGFLDVRHDGIMAELKVERITPVSGSTAPKYMGQPTQYAAADGARLSILAVLDMSPKTSPVGVPENYMFTLQPALHGLDNPEAPSLVAVIVINGNSPAPSTWSRRKTATQT
jgi:hypothetical protein